MDYDWQYISLYLHLKRAPGAHRTTALRCISRTVVGNLRCGRELCGHVAFGLVSSKWSLLLTLEDEITL